MHFLSHFYVEQAEQNPLTLAGLIMPDLTPGFSKLYNSILAKQEAPENEALLALHSGILKHYQGDKWFHQSILFTQPVSHAIEHFIEAGLNRKHIRLSVLAHVAVEMMIDRHILLNEPELCQLFYRQIVQADEGIMADYFQHYRLDIAKQKFFYNFQFFKEKKFLYLFHDLNHLVFGLNRIYGSVTQTEFTNPEKAMLLSALHNIDTELRYSWQEILKR